MEIRITFRSEIYIKGDTLEEINSKWENIPLFSEEANECNACEIEVVSVEDADTFKNLEDEWNKT